MAQVNSRAVLNYLDKLSNLFCQPILSTYFVNLFYQPIFVKKQPYATGVSLQQAPG